MTINEIQREMRAAGSHWWDADTMRFFGTKPDNRVYSGPGGVYFATEDDDFEKNRGWAVRQYKDGDIHTVGELCQYPNRLAAREQCVILAGRPGGSWVEEPFNAIHPVDDLIAAFRQHAKVEINTIEGRRLMTLAGQHHRGCERECNEGGDRTDAIEHVILAWLKKHAPNTGVKFSGDPRGCTVKLLFPDKAANDMAAEGWCVPRHGE